MSKKKKKKQKNRIAEIEKNAELAQESASEETEQLQLEEELEQQSASLEEQPNVENNVKEQEISETEPAEIEAIEFGEEKKKHSSHEMGNARKLQNCLLFVTIAFSVIVVLSAGACETYFGKYKWAPNWESPAFMAVVNGEMDETEVIEEIVEPDDEELLVEEQISDVSEAETEIETVVDEESVEEETTPQISEELAMEYLNYYGEEPYTLSDRDDVYYVTWNNTTSSSYYYNDPGVRPVSSVYDYKNVDSSYYSDCLFIGDSRIEGLYSYSGWSDATFCYKRGLTAYSMFNTDIRISSKQTSTVEEVLASKQFKNVYIMIGINELGKGDVDDFAEVYSECILKIKEYQPDARIIIMGIMFETKPYSDSKPVYNNDNINARNVAIAKLANGNDIFFLDMNPSVADDTGVLADSYSFDGVHMKAQYYDNWINFMYAHGF